MGSLLSGALPRGGRYRRSPPAHDDAHEPVVAFGGDLVSGGCEYLDGGTRRDLFGCCASRQSDLGLLGHHVLIERRVLGSLGPDGGSVEVHQHETCYEPHRNSPCQGSRHRNRHGSLLSESFGTVFRPVSSAAWGRKGDRSIFLSLASCLGHPRVMKKEPVPISLISSRIPLRFGRRAWPNPYPWLRRRRRPPGARCL